VQSAQILSSLFLSIFRKVYRSHAAQTVETAAGELSPAAAVAPIASRHRFAAAAVAVGDGVVSGTCYPCSGRYSNTYQPQPRWCMDTPRRSCRKFPDKWRRRPPLHSDTRRTAMPRRQRLRGPTASPEAVPNHLARRPPGRAIDTRSPAVPCKTRMTVSERCWCDVLTGAMTHEDLMRRMFAN